MRHVFLIFLLYGCSHSGKVKLISSPSGAYVESKNEKGIFVSLGQTPLEVSSDKFEKPTAIRFTKEGHSDQNLLVVGDPNKLIEISTELKQKEENSRSIESANRLEKLAREIVTSHNLIGQKRFREAELILQSLTREYPVVSVTYDLLGNIAYLEKNRPLALKHYEKSLKLNPENSETQNMVDRLKE